MTFWENKQNMYAIDGLTVVSAVSKSQLKFVTCKYETINWDTLTEISREQFYARHTEVKNYINEVNEKFNL